MALFNDPIGWAERAVGNNRRFVALIVAHILLFGGLISSFIIFDEVRQAAIPAIGISVSSLWMIFLYLYALKKLLEEVKRRK